MDSFIGNLPTLGVLLLIRARHLFFALRALAVNVGKEWCIPRSQIRFMAKPIIAGHLPFQSCFN